MRRAIRIDGPVALESGDTLEDVTVSVRTWGSPADEAVLVCHALTGNADVDEWWPGMLGSGRALDPDERFIVSMNVLGGRDGTTGPTTTDPATGMPYGPGFPAITIRDMVAVQRRVLDRMGVRRLALVIGGSMGGMQVLEWAASHPDAVRAAVPIGVGATQSAWAVALSEAQRHAIVTDPGWRGGWYDDRGPEAGLATARMIAMVSYRSPAGFDARFGRTSDERGFAIQSYLRYQGRKLVDRFDANTYLTLIGAMDSHDLGCGRGPLEAILRRIDVPMLVVGISSDVLYPVAEVRHLAASMPHARFAVLDSPHGHDAFLIDTDHLNRMVTDFLAVDAVSHDVVRST